MEYYFKPSALRDLKKLPKVIQKRLIEKMDYFLNTGNPLKFAETLQDKSLGEYRFRVGDYRIIFDVSKGDVVILTIGHRREIYR